jgi:uncharacterized membrane protein
VRENSKDNGRRFTIGIAAGAILLIGAALRLHHLGAQPLWLDEAASLELARLPLADLWRWEVPADVGNPPLYYTLLKGWLWLGESESSLRLLSVLFGVAAIPVIYGCGRQLGGRNAGLIAAALLASSPLHVRYSQEARGYSLLVLAVTIGMWGLIGIIRAGGRPPPMAWVAYVGGTAAALLTHNIAIFFFLGANAAAAACWRLRAPRGVPARWLAAQAGVAVIWAAWLPGLVAQQTQVGERFWIPAPNVREVVFTAHDLYAHATLIGPLPGRAAPLVLAFGLLVAATAASGLGRLWREPCWATLTVTLMLIGPVGALVVGWLWRPLLVTRTLLWATVPLYLLMACGLVHLTRRRTVSLMAAVGLVAMHSLGLWNVFVHVEKEAWDRVAAYVAVEGRPGDAIIVVPNVGSAPLEYYLRRHPSAGRMPMYGVPAGSPTDRWRELVFSPADVLPVQVLAARYDRVWLVYSHESFADPQELVPTALDEIGHLADRRAWYAVQILLYEMR